MGVHGLWELLAPVGRRVSVETLAGKKLAIDASIWMIQFMKAMRDERGEMVRNAHILGFFRRICKLLYLRTKPVFVFDGGTPALKRRTVIARRRQRENAQAKIRKTAEKLLLNQLKAMRLKELAADLEKQRQENVSNGKRKITEEHCNEQETQKGKDEVPISYNQEELDEMLAASIAAEENEGFNIGASTSGIGVEDDEVFEEDDDEDEEMILPEMHGKVDPAVLAALPPSMQLDLLVQMRERLMAENRQKYQKVKKAPARFSELQIEAYLKTVAFRREIDGVRKTASGRGVDGVQTSRIASEANREFIFSTSYTGDKQALTSAAQERNGADQIQAPAVNSSTNAVNKVQSTKRSDAAAGPTVSESAKAFHDDIETYIDERGRLRVSRMRALGIRMTRDLQRNLDLMKEIDLENAEINQERSNKSATARNQVGAPDGSSGIIQHREATDKNNDGMNMEIDKTEEAAVLNGASIEISFEDTSKHVEYSDNDDKLFACLVAGDPVLDFSVDDSAVAKESSHSALDNEWEEGVTEGKTTGQLHEGGMSDEEEVEWEEGLLDTQLKMPSCPDERQKSVTKGAMEEEAAFQEAIRRSLKEKGGSMDAFHENYTPEGTKETVSDEDEVEWEEGCQDIQLKSLSCPDKSHETVTKGPLEEEASFQEAIRRSLEETSGSMDDFHENNTPERARETVHVETGCVSICEEKQPDVETSGDNVGRPFGSLNDSDTIYSEEKSAAFIELNPDRSNLELKLLNQDAGESGTLTEEVLDSTQEGKGFCMTEKQLLDTYSEDGDGLAVNKLGGLCSDKVAHNSSSSAYSSACTYSLHDRLLNSGSADAQHMFQAELGDLFCNTEEPGKTNADDSVTDVDAAKELATDKIVGNFSREKDDILSKDNKEQEITEDHLEEEIMFLDKEREELGSEQRKHERDAESVNSEMFVECQELLQMFGLPYIIAPMEAEAQCAFMELSNLVDGVVTDDSDAFLFGAQSVYKNIFDDRKYVETYLMKDIENELGLDRGKLIRMALLLGSDYTEGISGIGIVNAMEVVNAFPGKDGLREFREWIESPDPSILGNFDVETGGNSRKKGSKGTENVMMGSNSDVEGITCDKNVDDDAKRKKQIFMDKHRNVSKNWHISSSFPSDAVISAYVSPQVDRSTEAFSWGKPDLFVLRKLCWEKFGWGGSKADEVLLPVLKEYNKHETQLRLEAFYTFNERFAKIRSKRIEKAVKGITGSKSSALMDGTPEQSKSGRKRKAKPGEDEANQSEAGQNNSLEPTVKQSKRGKTKGKNSKSNLEQSSCVEETRKESHVRGRGRWQRGGRGKRKHDSSYADSEISNEDENDEDMQFHVSEEAHQVRRSGRTRKTVNYSVSDELENSDKEDETFLEKVGGIDKTNGNQLNENSDVQLEGGLLVEETEQTYSMIDDHQVDDPFDQGQEPKDYLQFGGGFCFNEDEEKELDEHASSPTEEETVPEQCGDDTLTAANSMAQEYQESDPVNVELNTNDKPSRSDDHSPDACENDSDDSSPKFLRAMPNLRRKKKKF